MKVLMAAPFDAKGRYKGGIMYVANALFDEISHSHQCGLLIEKFDTCRIERTNQTISRFSFENILNFFLIYFHLVDNIKKSRPSVLYYHSSIKMALLKDLLVIRNVSKKTDVGSILHIHFAEYFKIMFSNKWINKIMIRLMNKYVNSVVFLSKNTADEFILHGLDRDKVKVLYNFHTLSFTEDEFKSKLARFDLNDNLRLLFIGSLDKRKGILDILNACAGLDAQVELHICGAFANEEIRKEYEDLVQKADFEIHFHGYVTGDEKKIILQNTDVLLLPSYGEGLPIVIMEAFGAGCSVVSTPVGAIPEIFKDESGFLIEPGDVEALRLSIKRLNFDRDLCCQQMKFNFNYGKTFEIQGFVNSIISFCIEVKNAK